MRTAITALIWLGLAMAPASAGNVFTVSPASVADEKAVFATVES